MARKIAVIDAETDPFLHGRVPQPFVWGYYDGDGYRQFETTAELVEFIEDEPQLIYAHNGGKFDFHFMLDYAEPFDTLLLINGRIASFRIGEAELRDSFTILPVPLSGMQKETIDYAIMEESERYKPENWERICAYLKSDCVNLYEYVTRFVSLYGRKITLASAAMNEWKKIAKNVPKTNAEYYARFAPFYFGGRVQSFHHGIYEGPFSMYDINSAYPYAMMHDHAYGDSFITDQSAALVDQAFYRFVGRSFGALPYRSKDGLEFPNDGETRTYYCTGWELRAGLDTGRVQVEEIIERHCPMDTRNFSPYMERFYREKRNADKGSPEYLFAKLFMNALYGKFGANPENYYEHTIVTHDMIAGALESGFEYCGKIGKWALIRKPLEEEHARYYNVATAASITGFVRAFLHRNMARLADSGCAPLYCDTDCIAFAGNTHNLDVGGDLGQWSPEGQYTFGAFAGRKLYAFRTVQGDWKTASKGVRLSPEAIVDIARGGTVTFQPDVPTFSTKHAPRFVDRRVSMRVK